MNWDMFAKVVAPVLIVLLGGGWIKQWVQNRGALATQREDELAKYRQDLRQENKDLEERLEKKIAALESENQKKDERDQKNAEKIAALERGQLESELDRELFENRVLNIIEFRWNDADAVKGLADEIRQKHNIRREKRRQRVRGVDPAHPRRILIVEDADDTAQMFKTALRLDGHDVEIARSAGDAIQQCNDARSLSKHFDVVILDYNMPGMNGVQCAQKLREAETTANDGHHAELLFVSGNANDLTPEVCVELNISGKLSKPLINGVDSLRNMVRDVLK